jgi:hypothetical protein
VRDEAGTPDPDELCIRNKAGNASRPYPDDSCIRDMAREPYPDDSCIRDMAREPYPDRFTGQTEGPGLGHIYLRPLLQWVCSLVSPSVLAMSDTEQRARDIEGGSQLLQKLLYLFADLLQSPILCYAGTPTQSSCAQSQI